MEKNMRGKKKQEAKIPRGGGGTGGRKKGHYYLSQWVGGGE